MKLYSAYIGFLALLSGCASSGHSIVDGRSSNLANPNEQDIVILAVDGKAVSSTFIERVDPGLRSIEVSSVNSPFRGSAESKTIEITIRPCHRYIVVAKHSGSLKKGAWQPILKEERKFHGCKVSDNQSIPKN